MADSVHWTYYISL